MVSLAASISQLPIKIPIFPLTGIILIPGSNLPLNIFEPRYLQMIRDAVTSDGLIGMVQPKSPEGNSDEPEVYSVGGVGKIDDLVDTGDNRFTIRLRGVARFEIASELTATTPYRQIHADWSRYNDLQAESPADSIDRRTLLAALSNYLDVRGLDADFDTIADAPNDVLVNSLSMIIPMGAPEKQALLEAASIDERAATLETLLKMSVIESGAKEPPQFH